MSDSAAVPGGTRFDPEVVRFVLVEPRGAANVGSVARALMNLGFSRLTLVCPGCDHLGEPARMMAVDARGILEQAEVHADLGSALEGARTVVGTSRRTGKHRQPHRSIDDFAGELARLSTVGETALVFGREDSGLTDSELDLCTHLVFLDSSQEYPSFNLAQAVLLVAHELRRAGQGEVTDAPGDEPGELLADHAAREAMYGHLHQALVAIGFLHEDSEEQIMRRFRRLFGRANLSVREANMLRGVARQILWATRQVNPGPESE
jgi:tRNA/rRNA methyltransferase